VIDESLAGDLVESHAVGRRDDDSGRHVRSAALGETVEAGEVDRDDLGIPALAMASDDVLVGLGDLVFGCEGASP
jgi:hypothetical protein